MRLTLRTMLAYLDNILEQEDAEALGAKISESEFASDLVYRTLSSTRKANLNAPALDGTGIGADPNTVAEYLDNTLPEERIPGFEKVCLESDMYLSEVACCHSVLSICMDEAVTIENNMRDRVLGLVQDSITKTEELETQKSIRSTGLENLIQPKPAGAPDYIRTKAHPLWRATVTLTFVCLMAIIVLRAVGPFDASHPWIGTLVSGSAEQGQSEAIVDPVEQESVDAADQSQNQSVQPFQTVAASENVNVVGTELAEVDVVTSTPVPGPLIDGSAYAEFLSDSHPVMQVAGDSFQRLVTGDQLGIGETLFSFQEFRPEFLLMDGSKLSLSDATRFSTYVVHEQMLGIQMEYGKLVLKSGDMPAYQFRLQAGDIELDLRLDGPRAIAALECVPYRDAVGAVGRMVRLVFNQNVTVSGLEELNQNAAASDLSPEKVTAYTVYAGNTEVTKLDALPTWGSASNTDSIMQEARQAYIQELTGSDNLVTQLQQLYEGHRLINVRRLAAYSLLELGDASAFVGLLDDGDYRALWDDDIRLMKSFIHREPVNQQQIETALQDYSSDNVGQLISFLGQFSDDQLLNGVANDMIGHLDSQITVERVIAFNCLQQITGKTLLYKPEVSPQRQTLPIRQWRELLSENRVTNHTESLVSTLIPK